ncbi:MAG TPA: ABC transporter ATP-binding protein, partial [Anaerolineae bacterium]|nr:ABC transporter ATP-binding protein [Anaerolineae bacterium]
MTVIEVDNLVRAFDGRRAVDGITFSVEEGEVFGFLGPNGAGKTTTLRLLTGQLHPTAGRAQVAGCDVVRDRQRLKPLIGVVFEHQNLYPRQSGRENLAFSAELYGVGRERVEALLAEVGLAERAGDRVEHYSNGMKQRLLIARALLHQPRVLFLDEPTRGLDPGVAREIRHLISDLAVRGVTIFLTTHYMEEADQLCRRVAFVHHGRIVALDTPHRLKIAHGEPVVRVTRADGQQISLRLDRPDEGTLLGDLAASGQIATLHSAEATLEEVFIQLTGRRLV